MKLIEFAFGLTAGFAGFQAHAAPDNERASRKAEIEFYTTSFDGGAAKLNCVRPAIPPSSTTNEEIVRVDREVTAWFDCYNKFAQTLNESLPPGKAIPADLARLMSPAELAAARARMNQVYATLGDQAEDTAEKLQAEHKAWREATQLFATTKNEETRKMLAARMIEFELAQRRIRDMTSNSNFNDKVVPPARK